MTNPTHGPPTPSTKNARGGSHRHRVSRRRSVPSPSPDVPTSASPPTTITPLRAEMIRQLQLHRLSENTQDAYIGAVAKFAEHYGRSPEQLGEKEIEDYAHHLLVERQLAWSTCNIALCSLKFFYTHVVRRPSMIIESLPRTRPSQLPEVLSTEDVERLIVSVSNPKHRALLKTTYAAGLRVSELVRLQLNDLDSSRMMIRVNQGKGKKDRYTVLSERLLTELREYWKISRPKTWLFPGEKPGQHLTRGSAEKTFTRAKKRAGISRGKGIHTLRHCFATHLLEAGVDPRTLQILLGHRSIASTMRYLHVTRKHLSKVSSAFDLLSFAKTLQVAKPQEGSES